MDDLSNDKLRLQRSHPITRLYDWSHFLLRRDASHLYATVVDLSMLPDIEKTNGVKEHSSTSLTFCSEFLFFTCIASVD